MIESVVERYLLLGLRLDKHVEGTVDAYFGPPELAAKVAAEPRADAHELAAEAAALLGKVPDSWLRDQIVGLHTFASALAGVSSSYTDEVYGCYGVRPSHTDEAVFAEAHDRLAELLPGSGTLAERHDRWRDSMLVPADRLESTIVAIIAEARRWTDRLIGLPAGEAATLQIVHDKPWNGFNHYLGDLRGRVEINADLPRTAYSLLHLIIHETYPGHQAERASKEAALVRGQGLLEEAIVLAPTPQSLISEGIAEVAVEVLLRGEAGQALAAIVKEVCGDFELAHSLAIARAAEPCRRARLNAAVMLHESGVSEADVKEYLRRWELISPQVADHVVRFMTEPTSRTYVFNYPEGKRLCRSYVEAVPDGFRRLLTEQIRVSELIATTVVQDHK